MEAKISNAQLEVWEWKNNLYEEIKDIPRFKKLKYIKKKVSILIEQIQIKSDFYSDSFYSNYSILSSNLGFIYISKMFLFVRT